MVAYDIYGKSYPCHRFAPFSTGKELSRNVNIEKDPIWKTEKCRGCDLLPVCPSCAGFNWEINNDPYLRTTFHCEALALEVMARCRYESEILTNLDKVEELSPLDQIKLKEKLEVLHFINENGFFVPQ
jgi:radical SAM protein with 4Fe4S-binding SPASM domain